MLCYTSWHQLFVYSCISRLLSADLFMLLLFSYLLSSTLDLLLSCTYCLYAQALPFSYTLIKSLLMTRDSHVQIWICFISVIRCSTRRAGCEESGVSSYLILIFLPPFIPFDSVVFLILYTLLSVIIPFLYSLLSCADIYMCIAVIMIYYSFFYSLFGLL